MHLQIRLSEPILILLFSKNVDWPNLSDSNPSLELLSLVSLTFITSDIAICFSFSFLPLSSYAHTMYTPPPPNSKIIIVGGGTFGLSTAYALSQKNKYDIWVFDRQEIPSPDAASTGNNNIPRCPMHRCMYLTHLIPLLLQRYQQDCSHGLWR